MNTPLPFCGSGFVELGLAWDAGKDGFPPTGDDLFQGEVDTGGGLNRRHAVGLLTIVEDFLPGDTGDMVVSHQHTADLFVVRSDNHNSPWLPVEMDHEVIA